MLIEALGAIGAFVGGLAVLLTLIYLAKQLKQSTVATHRQTYVESAKAISEFWLTLAREPELHEAFVDFLKVPESQSKGRRERGFLVMDAYLSLMESFYLHNEQYREVQSQQRWERVLKQLMNTPGGLEYWPRRRNYFHEAFADFIDSLSVQPDEQIEGCQPAPNNTMESDA